MIQTQWPGLGPNFDVSSLDAPAGGGPALWQGDSPVRATPIPASGDGVGRSWWSCGTANANVGNLGTSGGGYGNASSLLGSFSSILSALQQLAGALLNGANGGTQTATPQQWGQGAQGGCQAPQQQQGAYQSRTQPEQRFSDVDVSSTGDPHIAEVGTRAGHGANTTVDSHWDSMTSHDDLVHTDSVEGGYRVSTAVTQRGANGVTYNQSASVHANFGQDDVTMNRDGSYRIFSDGRAITLGKGESATLSGGERVDIGQNGALTVSAGQGAATISTTLTSTGDGVDVATHGHDIALGGDAIAHG